MCFTQPAVFSDIRFWRRAPAGQRKPQGPVTFAALFQHTQAGLAEKGQVRREANDRSEQ